MSRSGISISGAIDALAKARAVSLGRAKVDIIGACSAGLIQARWRGHYAGLSPVINRQQWSGADVDLDQGIVLRADGTRMALVDLDRSDFDLWLKRVAPAAKGRRYVDDGLIDEGVRGINGGKWPNPLQAATALASRAQGNSREGTITRLRKKIAAAQRAPAALEN